MTTLADLDQVTAAIDRALQAHTGTRRLAWTVKETADSLGTSPDTIRKLIRDGHLPTVPHMGTRQLVPVVALEQFVSAATPAAGARAADSTGATSLRSETDVLPLHRPVQGVGGPSSDRTGGQHPPAA